MKIVKASNRQTRVTLSKKEWKEIGKTAGWLKESQSFDHSIEPMPDGRHPEYNHLVLFELEPHYGSYILTAHGHDGSALLSTDDAMHIFEDRLKSEYAYLSDDYLDLLK